ncbi:hypothetical protein BVX97_04290 [bacterium E08(2017)]|nr:hypothetical protein BVX97_04290 [bacterium E08(2017)]
MSIRKILEKLGVKMSEASANPFDIEDFRRKRGLLWSTKPVLDSNDMFMFFPNNKVAQTSINRNLLKDRVIVFKDDHSRYIGKMHSYDLEQAERIFKFTVVRNPWDKAVSAFTYLQGVKQYKRKYSEMDFCFFVKHYLNKKGMGLDPHFNRQYENAFYNGIQYVDFIAKLETLHDDWKEIAPKIDSPAELPHKNKTIHKKYTDYYDDESVELVGQIYMKDVEAFGYTYGDPE